MGAPVGVLEGFIQFEREISIVGARGADGVFYYFPPFENVHRNHILDVTSFPAQINERVNDRAAHVAIEIAQAFDLVGLICVEMFVVNDDVIVNELAPRPHNSGHLTIDAFSISQFELQLRAVCGLPMANGARWRGGGDGKSAWRFVEKRRTQLGRRTATPRRQVASIRQGQAHSRPKDGTSHRAGQYR